MSRISIKFNNFEQIGFVDFTQDLQAIPGIRTAPGFRLQLPAIVNLSTPSKVPLLIEHLQATFTASEAGQPPFEIGIAYYRPSLRNEALEQRILFSWDWLIPTLAVYEKIRSGREAHFRVQVAGDIRFILAGQPDREPCSIASPFSEPGDVRYSRDTWVATLRSLNLRDAVLVEIPFPAGPPSGWETIWTALRNARDSFDRGGSTGWQNCIVGIRNAPTECQQLEKEDQGPGWQRPPQSDLNNRTKAQRIDNIRWHLVQLAHFAAHTKADEWTRDDALLALSVLCALFAARKP